MPKCKNKDELISTSRFRKEPLQYQKNIYKESKSNVANREIKKTYNYYKCDYCDDEIIIKNKNSEMTGGIASFFVSNNNNLKIKLVLCNKCVKPVIKILNN